MTMNYTENEKAILRDLGKQVAEIASLPINDYRKELYEKINNLEKAKPPIFIYEIPWHEMNVNDELTIRTRNPL